ncbi:hypothetical protein Nepgr_026756 [Nepenthes gracilis]|uniref:Uncharacterized protein n=1 Tax=Nepenthes gracilis TaxID=150966 RepID=A0AAD3Y0V1_NEPGR|nr:hypothetical protein Nepgr_026756 [Nepenthes gracilis]
MDDVLLCSMLKICANIVSLSLGKQIHTLVLKDLSRFDVATDSFKFRFHIPSSSLHLLLIRLRYRLVRRWYSLFLRCRHEKSFEISLLCIICKNESDLTKVGIFYNLRENQMNHEKQLLKLCLGCRSFLASKR